jgi:hypothetical protein
VFSGGAGIAAGDLVSATWPLKTHSFVTLASRTMVINCGSVSVGGVGVVAENVSGGITTLSGGSSCGAVGVDPNMWTGTGLVSLACSGMVKPLSASGAVPEMVFVGADSGFFAGSLAASVGSAGGGGGGAAASTVGITEVLRGAPAVISGGGCCASAVGDACGCFGFELLAPGNGLSGVSAGASDAGCAAATMGADGGGWLVAAGGRCGFDGVGRIVTPAGGGAWFVALVGDAAGADVAGGGDGRGGAGGDGRGGAAVDTAGAGADGRGGAGFAAVGGGGAVDLAISGCVDLGCGDEDGPICGWLAASLRKQRQAPEGPPVGDSFSPERKNSPSCGTIMFSLLN